MFKGTAALRGFSLPDSVPEFAFEIKYARNPDWPAKGSQYLKLPLFKVAKALPYPAGKAGIKAREADRAAAQAKADAELRRHRPLGGTAAVAPTAADYRMSLATFAPLVLNANRRNPRIEFRFVPVGPGTAAGDRQTWFTDCAHRVGAWTFRDLQDTDHALAMLNKFRDDLGRPYTAAERAADIARGCDPRRLRQVGECYTRNNIAKICSCVRTVLREAGRDTEGRPRLVSPLLASGFRYEGTRSTHAGKVDLSTASLDVFHACWSFLVGYRGHHPSSYHLTYFGLCWFLGARPGELLGLQWLDFNGLDGNGALSVTIKRALQTANKGEARTLGRVKNNKDGKYPDRTMDLPAWLRPVLQSWRQFQADRRDSAGYPAGQDWHVLTNEFGTMEMTGKSNNLASWWTAVRKRVIKRAGVSMAVAAALTTAPGLYAFRHTAACYLLRKYRGDAAKVAGMLGHSVKTLLESYALVLQEIQREDAPFVGDQMPANLPMPAAERGSQEPASNVVPFSDVAA